MTQPTQEEVTKHVRAWADKNKLTDEQRLGLLQWWNLTWGLYEEGPDGMPAMDSAWRAMRAASPKLRDQYEDQVYQARHAKQEAEELKEQQDRIKEREKREVVQRNRSVRESISDVMSSVKEQPAQLEPTTTRQGTTPPSLRDSIKAAITELSDQ
ncbi:MAG: hypothetical protein WBX25_34805 [Rhodomicrobium sp.]